MRVLVTGGAGFVGSHVVDILARECHDVTVVDDFSYGDSGNLGSGISMIQHESVKQFLDRSNRCSMHYDAIYHFAGIVGVEAVMNDPIEMLREQSEDVAGLCSLALAWKSTFVLASSSEVYGASDQVPFTEDAVLQIPPSDILRSAYPIGKLFAEHVALSYAKTYGMDARIVRLFNIVGPRQRAYMGCVLPRIMQAMLREEVFSIHGDGQQTRCFTHVAEASKAIVEVAHCIAGGGAIVNIGSDDAMTIAQMATDVQAYIEETYGRSGKLKFINMSDLPRDEGWEANRVRQPSLVKLESLIGWTPGRGKGWKDILRDTASYWAEKEGHNASEGS